MGTGVVAFNIQPKSALLCDINPHLIAFYRAVQAKEVTAAGAKRFLVKEGAKLLETEGEHYYAVRERFNQTGNPLDFLFLSRACFNGMMRFNKKGGFNVPFCRKPERFAQALVTKICNQISAVSSVIESGDYTFRQESFDQSLTQTGEGDLIYCDPPYLGRHVDYFDSWTEGQEKQLHEILTCGKAKFILSTWLKNKYRSNEYVFSLWGGCSIGLKEHFYHVGANETNRNAVYEALLANFHFENSCTTSDLDIENLHHISLKPKNDEPLAVAVR